MSRAQSVVCVLSCSRGNAEEGWDTVHLSPASPVLVQVTGCPPPGGAGREQMLTTLRPDRTWVLARSPGCLVRFAYVGLFLFYVFPLL